MCGLFKRVCVFACGLLCDLVRCVVCDVLCVLCCWCLCGVCVIECAMVYGLLLLTVCARVDLKCTSVFVSVVWDLMCDVVWFVCLFLHVPLICVCVGLVFNVSVRCL